MNESIKLPDLYHDSLNRDMKLICDYICKKLKGRVQAIYLTGSYARGEASYLMYPRYHPISDYDILLIGRKIPLESKTVLEQECTNLFEYDVRFFVVDISIYNYVEEIPQNLYGYDVCNCNILLYGTDILKDRWEMNRQQWMLFSIKETKKVFKTGFIWGDYE